MFNLGRHWGAHLPFGNEMPQSYIGVSGISAHRRLAHGFFLGEQLPARHKLPQQVARNAGCPPAQNRGPAEAAAAPACPVPPMVPPPLLHLFHENRSLGKVECQRTQESAGCRYGALGY